MLDLDVIAAAVDRRPVMPAALVSALGVPDAEAQRLADEVGERLARDPELCGRPPWRETVRERLAGPGSRLLALARWPVEGVPVVQVIDGEVVDQLTYSVTGASRHSLYRKLGWDLSASGVQPYAGGPIFPAAGQLYQVDYTAGWIMPGQIVDWSANLVVSAGGSASYGGAPGWVRASDRSIPLRFEVTVSGSMGTSEPVWPTTPGETVSSLGVVLTARRAFEMPNVTGALVQLAATILEGQGRSADIKSEAARGLRIEYGPGASNLPESLRGLR